MNERTVTEAASELEALRAIVKMAEGIFEFEGEPGAGADPTVILREALRVAREDFDVLTVAASRGELESSVYNRMSRRCDLALALGAYRARFGYREGLEGTEGDGESHAPGVSETR